MAGVPNDVNPFGGHLTAPVESVTFTAWELLAIYSVLVLHADTINAGARAKIAGWLETHGITPAQVQALVDHARNFGTGTK